MARKNRRPVLLPERAEVAWRLLPVTLVISLFLAGCGTENGGDDPTPLPTVTATPEPSDTEPTNEPTPWPEPTRPPEMDRHDIEGAKAAALYFVELYTYVYVTGDLQEWMQISHPDCQFCTGVVDRVESVHAAGGYADGPVIELVDIELEPPDDAYEFYSVWMDVVEHPSSRFDSSGAVIDTTAGGANSLDLALMRDSDEWRVRGAVARGSENNGGGE